MEYNNCDTDGWDGFDKSIFDFELEESWIEGKNALGPGLVGSAIIHKGILW